MESTQNDIYLSGAGKSPAGSRPTLQMNPGNFTAYDLSSLREELQQAGLDSWQAAELISAFLNVRGYGVSNSEARTAASRIESLGCNIQCMQEELSRLALVM